MAGALLFWRLCRKVAAIREVQRAADAFALDSTRFNEFHNRWGVGLIPISCDLRDRAGEQVLRCLGVNILHDLRNDLSFSESFVSIGRQKLMDLSHGDK
jgi:hypothetical protein